MKIRLIVDENISWRIKKLLPQWDILPANEIKENKRLSDFSIWQYAKDNNYAILTFDEDFAELQNLFSFPPKIIWLRTGNISTRLICETLMRMEEGIQSFLANQEIGVFEVYL